MLHAPDGKIGGNGRVSAPHTSCATPRRRISSAMLAMKTVNGDSPISGRNSARSRMSAIPTQQMSAIGTPMPHGSFSAERESPDEQRAEQQDLALRQIDDARGAVDHDERHGDQPVDEADQQSVDDHLERIDHGAEITLFMSWPRQLD